MRTPAAALLPDELIHRVMPGVFEHSPSAAVKAELAPAVLRVIKPYTAMERDLDRDLREELGRLAEQVERLERGRSEDR